MGRGGEKKEKKRLLHRWRVHKSGATHVGLWSSGSGKGGRSGRIACDVLADFTWPLGRVLPGTGRSDPVEFGTLLWCNPRVWMDGWMDGWTDRLAQDGGGQVGLERNRRENDKRQQLSASFSVGCFSCLFF